LAVFLGGCASASPQKPLTPALQLSATSFNFNTTVVGKTASQTLHITNSGTGPLTLNALSLQSQQFSISGPAVPRTVLPLQKVDYTVTFAPTTDGKLSASLQIRSNAEAVPSSVSLAGTAEKAFATLQASPSSVNFGNLKVQSTGTQNITLKNTGDIKMTISGVTVSGKGFGYSSLAPGYSLSPSQSVTFQIWFKPQAVGASSGRVSVLSANIASPADISVSGGGVASSTNPTPPSNPVTPHTVALSWQPSASTDVTGYLVYRSTTPGAGFSPLTTTLDALSYTDETVANGKTYYYVVTSIDGSGNESAQSNEVTAVIPAA
jgi:hypothetical protein